MRRLRMAKMRRPLAAEVVVFLVGISCFIGSSEATRPGPGTGIFSGRDDVDGTSGMMMLRPSLLLQRRILEEDHLETLKRTESKPDEQERKWDPKSDEKKEWIEEKPKEDEKKQWEPQPTAEDERKDWSVPNPKQDAVDKKWDSQPKAEEKEEWKPTEDAVDKKWDSQPKVEEKEWKPTEDAEKKWESQPTAEEEKKEWNPSEDVEKKSHPKAEDQNEWKPTENVEKKWDSQPKAEEKNEWKPTENVEKKWDSQPKAEEKNEWKPTEDVEKKWGSQPKADEKRDWKPTEDVGKKWDSQPKAEEEKKEWKPTEDVEKKWDSLTEEEKIAGKPEKDSQPQAEQEKKEWNPKEEVEDKWDSQPKAEEEKNYGIQEEPKKDEVASNPQESKPAESIQIQVKNEGTWQSQEPRHSETQEQQISVEDKQETWQSQEPKQAETQEQQISVEDKQETWQSLEPKQSEEEQQPSKFEEKWNAETENGEQGEELKAADENKNENEWESNNNWEDTPKEVSNVEEKSGEFSEVEDQKEYKHEDNVKETSFRVAENREAQWQEQEQQQQVEVRQQKMEDRRSEVDNEYENDDQSDLAEDYPDFLDELRNFPERFQKTAESVKDHIRYSGLDKYSTQSKELFNQANQQIQESFTPLLGKDYAPFLAYLVSYGLLLLPLILVTYLLDRIRARYSLQKILLFMNIYLSAYFAALLTVAVVLDSEPMNFFMKYSTSSYIFLQLVQAFGYLIYLLLNVADLLSTCSNGRIAAKFSVGLQWVVVIAVGFHYYVTVFHRAMERKAPLTNWKIYGFYSLLFVFLCLFARVERGKKQYTPLEEDDTTDKKN